MLLTEKKLRKIVRGILLKEADDKWYDDTENTGAYNTVSKLSIEEKVARAKRNDYLRITNQRMDKFLTDYLNDYTQQGTSDEQDPGARQQKLINYANQVKQYAKEAVEGPIDEAQDKFDMALATYRLILSSQISEAMKKDKRTLNQLSLLKTYAATGIGNIKKGQGQGSSKSKKPNPKIKTIQELLNKLNHKDYSEKELDPDGFWGKRTRSATSKALLSIKQKDEFEKLNINISNKSDSLFKNLNTSSKSGAGSWGKLALKLAPENKDKYDAVIQILKAMLKNNNVEPENEEGNEKDQSQLTGIENFKDNKGNDYTRAYNVDTKEISYILMYNKEQDKDGDGTEVTEKSNPELFKKYDELYKAYKKRTQKSKEKIENSRKDLVNQILVSVRNAPAFNNWLDRTNDYIYIDKESLIRSRYLYTGIQSNINTIKPINKTGREAALKQRIVYLDSKTNKTKPIDKKIENDIIDKTQEGFKMVFFRMKFGYPQQKTKYFVILAK